ncbi:hypothetical protein [Rubinisphaera sp.]|uniref:hypothetical protein n=1 Tax=Rubinisphaera sp. TaxID=2024857 RepID=UPI000C0D9973|nr:hypothetical protein [Rubinisphaera sp.]MBV09734.1 hypothetical protein [Rubinisphaera sp.]HCS55176.1 hypothetical protein [Planctomycetaceae bacterium]|tara:strand:+ start:11609 stop:11887 length:279 start_codon:yes stop_codon:yes gene_type:complete
MGQVFSEPIIQPYSGWKGGLTLCLVIGLMAMIWLFILPALSKDPGFQQQIQLREEQGVESAAMFYSDLPAAKTATEHLDQLERDNPNLFWLP